MKKIYFSFLVLASFSFSGFTFAQQVQWLHSAPINYSLNPEMPVQPACVSGDKIFAARLVNYSLNFGVDILGTMAIECYDTSSILQWSYLIGQKVVVESITADVNGNVYVGGVYMETLHLDGNDSLVNTGSGFDTNICLLSFDASGNLRWKRNVSLTHPLAYNLSALAIDHQENCWYGLMYFDSISVKKIDANGNDQQSHILAGTRSMNSFSFDPAGNIFLTGSTGSSGSSSMSVNGFSVNVPETYMMFVTRIDEAGNTSWIKLAPDVTFQSPAIVATATGDAYVAGNLMDSTSFGTVVFDGPQWVYDIFLTKVDSTGNFHWGIEVPVTQLITGDFQRGKKNFIDADAAGNVYLTGTIRGSVDWGNGVISDAGQIPSYGIAVISFDPNGTARWQVSGEGMGFVTPYCVSATALDECYFASSIVGGITFDSLSTNQGGNYAFLLGKISSQSSVGLDAFLQNEMLNIFPNPVSEQLSVISYSLTGTAGAISIYNVIGEKVLEVTSEANVKGSEATIDISVLPSGIYFLQTGTASAKFIVQQN